MVVEVGADEGSGYGKLCGRIRRSAGTPLRLRSSGFAGAGKASFDSLRMNGGTSFERRFDRPPPAGLPLALVLFRLVADGAQGLGEGLLRLRDAQFSALE